VHRGTFQHLFRRKPKKKQIPPLPLRLVALAQGSVGVTDPLNFQEEIRASGYASAGKENFQRTFVWALTFYA